MTPPLISTVIATDRNRSTLLPRAVRSILDQERVGDLEVWIVDDGSDDSTPSVLEELAAKDPRIHVLRLETSQGPGAARNAAIARCRGEYIAILDDDDFAVPSRLRSQSFVLEERPEIGLVFSAVRWVDAEGSEIGLWPGVVLNRCWPGDPEAAFELLWLDSNKISNATVMARREVLVRFPYAEDLHVGEDWFVFLQMAASGVEFAALPEPLVDVLRGDDHQSLMAAKTRAFEDQRRVMRRIRRWLAAKGDHRFDALHRRALARQMVREGRFWGGLRGLAKIHGALLRAPDDPSVRSAWKWILGRAAGKLGLL